MGEIGIDHWDAEEVLSTGYDCSRSLRRSTKIEKCLRIGNKVIRVVAELGPYYLNDEIKEVYYIIHASIETLKKHRTRNIGG